MFTSISYLFCIKGRKDALCHVRRMVMPFPTLVTPQMYVVEATLREEGDPGSLLCRKVRVVACTTLALLRRWHTRLPAAQTRDRCDTH
jgi:hypothetical protein